MLGAANAASLLNNEGSKLEPTQVSAVASNLAFHGKKLAGIQDTPVNRPGPSGGHPASKPRSFPPLQSSTSDPRPGPPRGAPQSFEDAVDNIAAQMDAKARQLESKLGQEIAGRTSIPSTTFPLHPAKNLVMGGCLQLPLHRSSSFSSAPNVLVPPWFPFHVHFLILAFLDLANLAKHARSGDKHSMLSEARAAAMKIAELVKILRQYAANIPGKTHQERVVQDRLIRAAQALANFGMNPCRLSFVWWITAIYDWFAHGLSFRNPIKDLDFCQSIIYQPR